MKKRWSDEKCSKKNRKRSGPAKNVAKRNSGEIHYRTDEQDTGVLRCVKDS